MLRAASSLVAVARLAAPQRRRPLAPSISLARSAPRAKSASAGSSPLLLRDNQAALAASSSSFFFAGNRLTPVSRRLHASVVVGRAMGGESVASHVPPAPGVSALYQSQPIAGRCALITGASSGIGWATAERLAELGCRLVIAARRADRLEALAEKLTEAYGVPVHCAALDVTDVDAVMGLPESLPEGFEDVSILINNAGGALGTAKCTENNMDDVATMLDANVKGLVACTAGHRRVRPARRVPPAFSRVTSRASVSSPRRALRALARTTRG